MNSVAMTSSEQCFVILESTRQSYCRSDDDFCCCCNLRSSEQIADAEIAMNLTLVDTPPINRDQSLVASTRTELDASSEHVFSL